MTNSKPKKINTKTLIILAFLYTIVTNFGDIRTGIKDGWNSVSHEKLTKPSNAKPFSLCVI